MYYVCVGACATESVFSQSSEYRRQNASERMLEFNLDNGNFRRFNNTAMPANSRQLLSDLHPEEYWGTGIQPVSK